MSNQGNQANGSNGSNAWPEYKNVKLDPKIKKIEVTVQNVILMLNLMVLMAKRGAFAIEEFKYVSKLHEELNSSMPILKETDEHDNKKEKKESENEKKRE